MNKDIHISLRIEKEQERQYILVPFEVDAEAERVDIRYAYPRDARAERDGAETVSSPCVIDLALEAPGGALAGASGSDREHIWVSPLGSSAGFARREVTKGTWRIIAGAYRVPEGGVTVEYDVTLTWKRRRLFRGDTHLHTTASDGTADIAGILGLARQSGLDFFFVTDHNNSMEDSAVPACEDVTILPGSEWTHYRGHAGFLGAKRPVASPYYTGSHEETAALFREAKQNGALVVVNHPFCPMVPWEWGFGLPFDAVEVWNGVMSARNERAVAWWHTRLAAGERIPATGGSDYHRPGLLGSVAMPCQCLYADSRSPQDLLLALRRGSGYISYRPDGPGVDIACAAGDGVRSFGDAAPRGAQTEFRFFGLCGGDEVRLITDRDAESVRCADGTVSLRLARRFPEAKFVRAEVFRSYAPGLPPMRALLSNPLYFE